MTSFQRFHAVPLAGLLLLATGAPAFADLTGHWRDAGGAMRHLVQVGDEVTMTVGSTTYEGTLIAGELELQPVEPAPDSYSFTVAPDESVISGTLHYSVCPFGCPAPVPVHMTRCGCFDDNGASGDGCDVECKVEECFACSGDPSTCVPVADATPCEHRSECIAGGTCQAGLCQGGLVDETCLDMSGSWLRAMYFFDAEGVATTVSEVVQEGATIRIYPPGSTLVESTAVLDPDAHTIERDGDVTGAPYCGGYIYEHGALAPDGRSFSMLVHSVDPGGSPGRCVSLQTFAEVAVRCADPGLETSDGCRVDSCRRCESVPETCTALPDGIPCASGDAYAGFSTCNGGECRASISDRWCPLCTASDPVLGCVAKPRENCRAPSDPRHTSLGIKQNESDSADTLRWTWKKGGAIQPYDFGRPDLYAGVGLCIFDESTATPALILAATVREDTKASYDVAEPSPWAADAEGSARYKERSGTEHGLVSIQLEAGSAANGSIKLKGRGEGLSQGLGLPSPALPLPLRAQLQIEGGACFEGRYGADGVSRNSDGVLRAKGTP